MKSSYYQANNFKSNLLCSIFIFLIFTSCADSIVTECEVNTGISPTLQLSKFSNIQAEIFEPNCTTSGCHSGSNPAANLDLTNVNSSYAGLVNISSTLQGGALRVKPGDSQNSYLVNVLNGTGVLDMPLGGALLDQSLVDSISVWIDNGAQNN
ncbi:MAG: hypothetical protein K9J12_13190 [Melioribacteraceae bacterium]|nr:hypothetical protein [Melioribacteraceae bacterium]MCF8263845.1 hypothetical protein [Melioribacteraceae bacterium]MCF8412526.1 hypothetical protein [Melioribacteraceae bacterium]MCF8432195.1 hypothetical protein [Melioribacteraceae bacterium]